MEGVRLHQSKSSFSLYVSRLWSNKNQEEANIHFISNTSEFRQASWGKSTPMASRDTVKRAEQLVEMSMKGNDASHDASHVWRVRDLALSLAREEGLSSNPDSMEIVNNYKFDLFPLSLCLGTLKESIQVDPLL